MLNSFVAFELITSVNITVMISWDVTPCTLVDCAIVSEETAASILKAEDTFLP
jgi:hypothetical protein